MRNEMVTPLSVKFHKERYDYYIKLGLTEAEAEEQADFDLIKWSEPISLPKLVEKKEENSVDHGWLQLSDLI